MAPDLLSFDEWPPVRRAHPAKNRPSPEGDADGVPELNDALGQGDQLLQGLVQRRVLIAD